MSSDETDAGPARSGRALDALNVFLADVRDGVGPYLVIYLTTKHWDPRWIGAAMFAMTAAQVAAQTPAGALIDATPRKRQVVALAAVMVAAACISMAIYPAPLAVIAAQVTAGAASAIFGPAIAAISLGMVGHAAMARRMGRNEAFNHGGNVASAALAGLIGWQIGFEGIFYLVAVMCAGSVVASLLIRGRDIDQDLARGGEGDGREPSVARVGALLKDRRIGIFALAVVLFHFANAAMLPLAGQKVTAAHKDAAALSMSACIIAAQLVMIPVAIASSRLAVTWGRKPVFLIAFAVLPIRGLLYTFSANPYFLVAVQLLDGIGAGIFGVVGVLVIADLTRGTGRFNLMQGALSTATGLGASLSNLMTGFIVGAGGYNTGFLALSAIAAVALAFFAIAMPETLNSREPAALRGIPADMNEGGQWEFVEREAGPGI